jgi:hypothetical protein
MRLQPVLFSTALWHAGQLTVLVMRYAALAASLDTRCCHAATIPQLAGPCVGPRHWKQNRVPHTQSTAAPDMRHAERSYHVQNR